MDAYHATIKGALATNRLRALAKALPKTKSTCTDELSTLSDEHATLRRKQSKNTEQRAAVLVSWHRVPISLGGYTPSALMPTGVLISLR